MDMVVVLELGHRQAVISVILWLINEDAKILLQLLVDSFSLPMNWTPLSDTTFPGSPCSFHTWCKKSCTAPVAVMVVFVGMK
jgi:hypothetical protein